MVLINAVSPTSSVSQIAGVCPLGEGVSMLKGARMTLWNSYNCTNFIDNDPTYSDWEREIIYPLCPSSVAPQYLKCLCFEPW